MFEGIVVGVVLAVLLSSARAWSKKYWRGTSSRVMAMWGILKLGSKMFFGYKRTRHTSQREFISMRRRVPLWLLRKTLFRWFEISPKMEWPYVMNVLEEHSKDQAKVEAKALLWDIRTVQQLKPRDIWEGQHVTLVHPCTKYVFVLTDANSSNEFSWSPRSADQTALVQRGWCSNVRKSGDSCRYCDRSDHELQQLTDSLMSQHECPAPSSPG